MRHRMPNQAGRTKEIRGRLVSEAIRREEKALANRWGEITEGNVGEGYQSCGIGVRLIRSPSDIISVYEQDTSRPCRVGRPTKFRACQIGIRTVT
jgi:cephalosporin hydroxylase